MGPCDKIAMDVVTRLALIYLTLFVLLYTGQRLAN